MGRANDRLAAVLASKTKCHVDSAECRIPSYESLYANDIRSHTLTACRVGFDELVSMGADSAHKFRLLGFDAIDFMIDSSFLRQLIQRFGIEAVSESFVTSASDAVCIAGTHAQDALRLTLNDLLRKCVGSPLQGRTVVEQAMVKYNGGMTSVSGIRMASPLVGCEQALLEAGVSLAQCAHVEGGAWRDVETSRLTLDQKFRLGLPVLRLGNR
jgi:hypothetical protein